MKQHPSSTMSVDGTALPLQPWGGVLLVAEGTDGERQKMLREKFDPRWQPLPPDAAAAPATERGVAEPAVIHREDPDRRGRSGWNGLFDFVGMIILLAALLLWALRVIQSI